MTNEEFYNLYANTPLKERNKILDNGMILSEVYNELKVLENTIRPAIIRQRKLLNMVNWDKINNKKG